MSICCFANWLSFEVSIITLRIRSCCCASLGSLLSAGISFLSSIVSIALLHLFPLFFSQNSCRVWDFPK